MKIQNAICKGCPFRDAVSEDVMVLNYPRIVGTHACHETTDHSDYVKTPRNDAMIFTHEKIHGVETKVCAGFVAQMKLRKQFEKEKRK